MAEGNVTLRVRADVQGKGELGQAAEETKKLGEETEKAGEKQKIFHLRSIASFAAMQNLRSGLSGVTMGFRALGLGNELVNAALEKFHAVTMIAVGAMQLAAGAKIALASATWAHVAALVAENTWLAPVVLGVIAGALAGLIALKATHMMAAGGEGIVTRPTMFMAGEAGPEAFSFRPLGGSSVSSSNRGGDTYNFYGVEKEAAEDIGWNIKLAQAHGGGQFA